MKTMTRMMALAGILLFAATLSAEAAGRCRSEADKRETAEEFCEQQLQCSQMTPPQVIKCSGHTGRWICQCVKPTPAPSPTPGNEGGNNPNEG